MIGAAKSFGVAQAQVSSVEIMQREIVRLENMLQDLMSIIFEYSHLESLKCSDEIVTAITQRMSLAQKMIFNQLQDISEELQNDEIWVKFRKVFTEYSSRAQLKITGTGASSFLFTMLEHLEQKKNPFQGVSVIQTSSKFDEAKCMAGVGRLMKGLNEADRIHQIYKTTKAARPFEWSEAYERALAKVQMERERAAKGHPSLIDLEQKEIEKKIKEAKGGAF